MVRSRHLLPNGVDRAYLQANQQYGYAAGATGQPQAQPQVPPLPTCAQVCVVAWPVTIELLPHVSHDHVVTPTVRVQTQYGSYQQQLATPAAAATQQPQYAATVQQQQYAATGYGGANASTHGGAQQAWCLLLMMLDPEACIRGCS